MLLFVRFIMSALLLRTAFRTTGIASRSFRLVNVRPVTAARHKWQSGSELVPVTTHELFYL